MTASDSRWKGNGIRRADAVKEAWGVLTDDELDRTEGKWDRLVGVIKERTGESAGDIERKLRELFDKI